MASLLDAKDSDTLLEPSAGDGHLIDAVKRIVPNIPVTAYELHPKHADNLRKKFPNGSGVDIFERDTILCPDLDLRENFGYKFAKIIANPPYGGWQDHERRACLKKRFSGFYVRETYTLFLLRCLRLLEDQGKLVFIIPDTFLYLHLHSPLRRLIVEEYTFESIDVFKSSLFPGVSFGYAKLCIIAISARNASPEHSFRIRFLDALSEFECAAQTEENSKLVFQKDILKAHSYTIPVSPNQEALHESSLQGTTMGDIAECVTGFYSGRDKEFLRRASDQVKRSNGYEIVDQELVEPHPSSVTNVLEGIESKRSFIPVLKGGGYNFIKPNLWFVDWSRESVAHYRTDKKARFQNPSFYFREGVGFPMVTSTRPTAALIQDALFDQSIVGIFPKTEVSVEFLLAYCNSKPFWVSLKAINPSANNSARYVLRTPVFLPDAEVQAKITQRTKELIYVLQNGDSASEVLMKEILHSITVYVKKMADEKALEPTALRAAAQL